MLFLDGDHSYKGVKQDFLLWEKYLCNKGILAIDDYKESGVKKFLSKDLQNECAYFCVKQGHNTKYFAKINEGR